MSGTNKKLFGGGFHHVFLKVSDIEKSIKFYTEVLGFIEKTSWGTGAGKMVLLDTGDGNYFELGQGDANEGGRYQHVALRTDNCDKAIETVRQAGAEITMEPRDIDLPTDPPIKIRIAFFKGPDGEVIELFQNEAT
ncbi:TPA: VOC family protein [Candidatus Poribacteria bacterium]|nr:VOC family protein [Candidatus Poribacteria bacterium]